MKRFFSCTKWEREFSVSFYYVLKNIYSFTSQYVLTKLFWKVIASTSYQLFVWWWRHVPNIDEQTCPLTNKLNHNHTSTISHTYPPPSPDHRAKMNKNLILKSPRCSHLVQTWPDWHRFRPKSDSAVAGLDHVQVRYIFDICFLELSGTEERRCCCARQVVKKEHKKSAQFVNLYFYHKTPPSASG